MISALLLVMYAGRQAQTGGRPLRLPPPYENPSARAYPVLVRSKVPPRLKVPPGFKVNLFAAGLHSPRWLMTLPNGDVLCTESYQGRIVRLRDTDGNGVSNSQNVFAHGLRLPSGMTIQGGYFYVANTNSVYRYPFRVGQSALAEPPTKVLTGIPSRGWRQHWTRNILFEPDGRHFFLTVGSETNKTPESPPRATILRYNADGTGGTVWATGLRNPVGLAYRPGTRELWTSCVERDYMGDDLVPDFLTRVRQGDFFGWPYYYIGNHVDPVYAGRAMPLKPVTTPDVPVTAHSVPLQFLFYQGAQFPPQYRGDLFVAMRGSTNRRISSGYKVMRIHFENGRPARQEDFVTGWVKDPRKHLVYGRPVGIALWHDGSLLISDEAGHRIWRVSYVGTRG